MRAVLGENAARALEHRGDRGLVVGAEDRAAGVAHDAVFGHRLERSLGWNRVQVRAEEDRRPAAVPVRPDAAVEVAHVRADGRAGVVLVDGQAEVPQIARDRVRNGTLLARRARDCRQLGEEVEDLRRHR